MQISENKLLIVSGSVVVAGLCVLGYAIYLLEANPLPYEEFLEQEEIRVVLTGNITHSRTHNDMTFVEIRTDCTLPGILFEAREIPQGNATITGTKKYYKGKPEIIIDQVKQ